jgi:hypothetical protein
MIGAGVVGGAFITPFGQSACAKHCSPGGLRLVYNSVIVEVSYSNEKH